MKRQFTLLFFISLGLGFWYGCEKCIQCESGAGIQELCNNDTDDEEQFRNTMQTSCLLAQQNNAALVCNCSN